MSCDNSAGKAQQSGGPLSAERRFQLLVEHVIDYAIYMLDPSGVVISWNAGAQRFKGYAACDIIGQHFSCFYTEEDRAAGKPELGLRTALQEGKFETEGWRVRKDGTRFWASVVIDAIRDEAGELIGFAKITRDITERKAAQEALEQARAELLQVQKMEAVGQLSGGIAHDFNNLLQALSGCLKLIERRAAEPAIRPVLEAGNQAIEHGTKLVRQLMSFARQQDLRPEAVDVRDRVLGMSALLARALRADIRLESDFAPSLWAVQVDPTQFELALLNLAVNARDAMPHGGALVVRACNQALPAGDPRGVTGDFVHLTITDTGSGMPPEVLGRAFDPYFTTKDVGKGSGLGLSQVYGFVRNSGGAAWIDSAVGKGTTVHVLLPRSPASPPVPADVVAEQRPQARRSARVLVVEDDAIVSMTVAAALEDVGFVVERAVTADDALPILAAGGVDLLFSDVVMPGTMNGVELAREAQRRQPGLPIILATGYSEDIAKAAGIEVLPKPYRVEQLIKLFDKVLSKAAEAPEAV
ncbi:PAS domain-containing sensor histidine kinase [Azospirillum rugosum]|jgi:PAS domain S-box-containing protein|uniref:histidine kinase n=1 Tax=Azospirillum rugosum TaxID=416170 RepID=A0ABS4SS85_9PROT|nr:PAS domain-containing sensor histidine kinase [Azospirillum rugosum]MBP2295421.1 PAS domain S-box-containing protein [Azospirillum rugosum]MDQ0528796.1 PAS domain S-box-containing protein [Azospirillum rugosum]